MRTAKCVILPVVVALAGIVALAAAAGQDNPPKPPQAPPRELSNTQTASCVVRITVDPAILPLNLDTVSGLVYSSAVVGQAAREVLHQDLLGDAEKTGDAEQHIQVEWLDTSAAQAAPAARPTNEGYDDDIMTEMQKIYGEEYLKQMQGQEKEADKTGNNRKEQSAPKNQNERRGTSNAPRSSGMANPYGSGVDSRGAYGVIRDGVGVFGRSRTMGGMGGMGMGGFNGGMMGGMGMGGFGGWAGPRPTTGAEQTATIKLSVNVARDMPPAANEFLRAVISNLRSTLRYAYESYLSDLDDQLEGVRRQHAAAIDTLQGGMEPAASQVMEQLRQVVDLSALNRTMPLGEAVELLRKSVRPPLQIVVLWNVLVRIEVSEDNLIGIDALPNVRLGTALDLVVKNIASSGPLVVYKIEGDVIVIGPESRLQEPAASREPAQVETDVRTLAAQRNELTRRVQDLDLELASLEARRDTIEQLILQTRAKADKQVAEDTVMQELQRLVELHTKRLADLQAAVAAGRPVPGNLAQPQEDLTRAKIELARRREELSKSAGGSQLDELTGELSRMTIDKAEKEMQRKILESQLQVVQQQLAQASVFDPQAARIRVAQEALDIAAGRMAELQMRMANLQPPTVTVIGAN